MLLTTASVTSRKLASTFIRSGKFIPPLRTKNRERLNRLYGSSMTAIKLTQQESSQVPKKPILAKKVSCGELEECGARLRNGDLVAFPTETVYGLGCHALDPDAVSKVFAAKERPLTDPLIVHVTKTSDAHRLWNADENSDEGRALQVLCDEFWPGPLTLVAKAAENVPQILMANTGYVACRSPSHSIARSLIDKAMVPIAAPSANKFGHVSPTRAHHVYDDLLHEDVWIVDPVEQSSSSDTGVCNVGVESTVAKITCDDGDGIGKIVVLRQGAVSVTDFEAVLAKAGLDKLFKVEAAIHKTTADHVATVAPGQTVRHYAPHIPSFILAKERYETPELSEDDKESLSSMVIIDYGQRLSSWKQYALAYRELSASNNSAEAAKDVFETLRWAELVDGATKIIFPEISASGSVDALTLALKDRLTRAASGVVIHNIRDNAV